DPVGAGPFLLEEWVRDAHMRLVPNPDWFDAPRPYLDTLTFQVVSDEQQRLDTLLTGGGDLNFTSTQFIVDQGTAEGHEYINVLSVGSPVYAFNLTQPPFDDLR